VVTICTISLTFNNSTFCPNSVFMCFLWIWEQTAIIYLYSINWLVFIREIYPFKAQWLLYVPSGLTFNNSTFCPHSVFMCFVWIWEQTAIISLYSINWLVFIRDIYPFKAQWLLYVPPGLTFNNFTFCPNSVFMCFMDLRTNSDYFPIQQYWLVL
jgi:hypothetical protein